MLEGDSAWDQEQQQGREKTLDNLNERTQDRIPADMEDQEGNDDGQDIEKVQKKEAMKMKSKKHLAQVIKKCLVDFIIQGPQVIVCTRDGASVNGAALNIMKPFWPNLFSIIFVSHTLDNVGQHLNSDIG